MEEGTRRQGGCEDVEQPARSERDDENEEKLHWETSIWLVLIWDWMFANLSLRPQNKPEPQ